MASRPERPHDNSQQIEQALAEAAACHQAGRMADAGRLYRRIIDVVPDHITALYRLSLIYIQTGILDQAIPLLEKCLEIHPRNSDFLNSLGVALQNAGRSGEAVEFWRRSLSIDAGHIATLRNLGRFQYEKGHFSEAVLYFKKALGQNPDHVDALSALGAAYWAMGCRAEAQASFIHALQLEPGDAKNTLNFGEFLYDSGRVDEALAYFDRALALAPDYASALWRKSFALLAKGEYREGWKLYAECLGPGYTRANLFGDVKPWDGKPGIAKRLLIWCEQGFGDSLQFIRYAELCRQRVGKVSVFCQKPLARLFEALPFIDHASDTCDTKDFDEHVPIMNLPYLFATTLETIPATIPYLFVDPAIEAKWKAKFDAASKSMRVGLVWAGGAHAEKRNAQIMDSQRSLSLESIRPWFALKGIQFYSLQKDKAAAQIAASGLSGNLTDFMGEVADFADTAAIIKNLDLVITVDTAAAHLAGALGKPVWIMSRYNADWRWLQNRPTNPWYPTARIFGQPAMGDWDSVIAEIGHELDVQKNISSRL